MSKQKQFKLTYKDYFRRKAISEWSSDKQDIFCVVDEDLVLVYIQLAELLRVGRNVFVILFAAQRSQNFQIKNCDFLNRYYVVGLLYA